jgi:Fe-S-cluster containining protein
MDKLNKRLASSPRIHYPEDEARYPWLTILFDAYHLTDTGSAIEIIEEGKKRNSQPGCHTGCCNCCIKANVPVSPLEKNGITWFTTEKVTGETRLILEKQLFNHEAVPHCLFLVNSLCSIYPVRPLACRIFYVFGKPCESPDDIGVARRADIWSHSRELARRVAMLMLPFYGITGKAEKTKAFEEGYIFSQMTLLLNEPWEEVADQMLGFDEKGGVL